MTEAEQANRQLQDWEHQRPDASMESNLRQAYPVAGEDTLPDVLRHALERLRGRHLR